jgi:hypothetical protein
MFPKTTMYNAEIESKIVVVESIRLYIAAQETNPLSTINIKTGRPNRIKTPSRLISIFTILWSDQSDSHGLVSLLFNVWLCLC